MYISHKQLIDIQRSLNECWRHADKYGKALPVDSRDRRQVDEDLVRADKVLAMVQGMLE